MSNRGIEVEKIRTLLKFDGITTDLTDEELEIIINSKLIELDGFIDASIFPQDRTQITRNYIGNVYELDFYPIHQIAYLYLDDELISYKKYNVNYDLGIIYFEKTLEGVIKVQYTTGVSDKDITYTVFPLIKDMIAYNISYGKMNNRLNGLAGFVTSMHEGDTSLSFGSGSGGSEINYGYSPSINSRISEFAKKYKYRARLKWF